MQWRMGVRRRKGRRHGLATAIFDSCHERNRYALAFVWPEHVLLVSALMNLPNHLTISRVPLMFIVVGLMYADFPYAATLAFWLYIAAALTDWLDGKIA